LLSTKNVRDKKEVVKGVLRSYNDLFIVVSERKIHFRAKLGWCPKRGGLVTINSTGHCSCNSVRCKDRFKAERGIGAVRIKIPKKIASR
jgi:hypothetical protein